VTKPNVVRNLVKQLYQFSIRLAPRSSNPYASHLPILCAVGAIVEPERIVEFGSGLVSTRGFQNHVAFPKLVSLLSFENDPKWHQSVAEQVGNDNRIALRLTDGPIEEVVARLDFASTDLIFVDDSQTHEGRASTITKLAARRLQGLPIVIHDLDLWKIRRSAHRFDHVFCMDALNPQTGVVWNGNWAGEKALASINRLVKDHSQSIPANDPAQWARLFRTCEELPLPGK
jgi:hypothetical protein